MIRYILRLIMTAGNWTRWTDSILNILDAKEINVGDEFSLEQRYHSERVLKEIYPKIIKYAQKYDSNYKS
jgi:hypothetical protein